MDESTARCNLPRGVDTALPDRPMNDNSNNNSSDSFASFLATTVDRYNMCNDSERLQLMMELLAADSGRLRWHMVQYLNTDIVTQLPDHLLTQVLASIGDGRQLLECCLVSRSWHRAITRQRGLWRSLCRSLGVRMTPTVTTGPTTWQEQDIGYWKRVYVAMMRRLRGMETGKLFHLASFSADSTLACSPTDADAEFVRTACFVTVHHDREWLVVANDVRQVFVYRIQSIASWQLRAKLLAPRAVSCVRIDAASQHFACGCVNGVLFVYTLDSGSHGNGDRGGSQGDEGGSLGNGDGGGSRGNGDGGGSRGNGDGGGSRGNGDGGGSRGNGDGGGSRGNGDGGGSRGNGDGGTVGAGGESVGQFDARLLRQFSGHTSAVCSVSFSVADDLLVSGAVDGCVKTFRLSSGMLLNSLDERGRHSSSSLEFQINSPVEKLSYPLLVVTQYNSMCIYSVGVSGERYHVSFNDHATVGSSSAQLVFHMRVPLCLCQCRYNAEQLVSPAPCVALYSHRRLSFVRQCHGFCERRCSSELCRLDLRAMCVKLAAKLPFRIERFVAAGERYSVLLSVPELMHLTHRRSINSSDVCIVDMESGVRIMTEPIYKVRSSFSSAVQHCAGTSFGWLNGFTAQHLVPECGSQHHTRDGLPRQATIATVSDVGTTSCYGSLGEKDSHPEEGADPVKNRSGVDRCTISRCVNCVSSINTGHNTCADKDTAISGDVPSESGEVYKPVCFDAMRAVNVKVLADAGLEPGSSEFSDESVIMTVMCADRSKVCILQWNL